LFNIENREKTIKGCVGHCCNTDRAMESGVRFREGGVAQGRERGGGYKEEQGVKLELWLKMISLKIQSRRGQVIKKQEKEIYPQMSHRNVSFQKATTTTTTKAMIFKIRVYSDTITGQRCLHG